jgi:hypothetical protein
VKYDECGDPIFDNTSAAGILEKINYWRDGNGESLLSGVGLCANIRFLVNENEQIRAIAHDLASALKDHYKILYGNAPYEALSKPCPTAKALMRWEEFLK